MDSQDVLPRKLWEHPDPKSTLMWEFLQDVNRRSGRDLTVNLNSMINSS